MNEEGNKKNQGKKFISHEALTRIEVLDETLDISPSRLKNLNNFQIFFNQLSKTLHTRSIQERKDFYKQYLNYNFIFVPITSVILFEEKPLINYSLMTIQILKSKISNKSLNLLMKEDVGFIDLMKKKILLFSLPFIYRSHIVEELRETTCFYK